MTHRPDNGRASSEIDVNFALGLALRLANQADDLALAGFRTDHGVEMKGDGTPVTRVDREVESSLRDMISSEMPRSGILGEEYGETAGDDGCWVIDPIDGTEQFIAGDARFSTLIAYQVSGRSLVGVVSAPALGLRWWAALGKGAYVSHAGNAALARVSKTDRADRAVGILLSGMESSAFGPAMATNLSRAGMRMVRRAVSWEAVRVASGEFDLAMVSGAIWDVAPLPVIVSEAGGVATQLEEDGERISSLLTNKRILEAVQAAI